MKRYLFSVLTMFLFCMIVHADMTIYEAENFANDAIVKFGHSEVAVAVRKEAEEVNFYFNIPNMNPRKPKALIDPMWKACLITSYITKETSWKSNKLYFTRDLFEKNVSWIYTKDCREALKIKERGGSDKDAIYYFFNHVHACKEEK